MKFKLYDCVFAVRDLPEYGISAGTLGAILEVFDTPHIAYEVEFCNSQGETVAVVTLKPDDIRPQ